MKAPHLNHDFLPGLRIIKTVLAVFFCLLISYSIKYYNPIYAVISTVLMMRASVEESFKAGIDRTIGTIIGGTVAILTLELMNVITINIESNLGAFFITGAVFVSLMITKILNMSSYVGSMASVVLLIAMISYGQSGNSPFHYISIRVIETISGILIAVVVNRYFNPKVIKKK